MDIHRCRFVDFPPSAINALAFSHSNPAISQDEGRLAVGRANGDIEIWNPLNGTWLHETTLYGGKDRSVEGLAWVQDPDEEDDEGQGTVGKIRLFSIGCSSAVTEWDLNTGLPTNQSTGSHSEVWCIAAQPPFNANEQQQKAEQQPSEQRGHQSIAIGCADGSVVLLSTQDNGLAFDRFIARTSEKKARALCMTWKTRNILAVGFADSSIRIYSVSRNKKDPLLRTISLGGGPRGGRKEKLVWSLACLPDGNLVSGDSTGEVCWWDRDNYGQLQKIQAHDADVLCLASSSDGKTVFSGGIDRRTVTYTLSSNANTSYQRWAKNTHKRIHTKDVKAMDTYTHGKISVVVSGGPDAHLTINPLGRHRQDNHRRIPFVPQNPPVAGAKRFVASWWNNQVTIWRIRRQAALQELGQDAQQLPNYEIIARMGLKGEENITTACLSEDGRVLAVSTMAETKIFRLRRKRSGQEGTFKVSKMPVPARLAEVGARLLRISPDCQWLLIVSESKKQLIFDISTLSDDRESMASRGTRLRHLDRAQAANDVWATYNERVVCASFSTDSSILATATLAGQIDVWRLRETNQVDAAQDRNGAYTDSDDDSDASSAGQPTLNQHSNGGQDWEHTPYKDALPKLSSGPLALSFCPQEQSGNHKDERRANGQYHQTFSRLNHLVVITASHEIFEFSALRGRMTGWSRRNPSTSLPASFQLQRDRTMGCFWDCSESETGANKRLWLYGATWLCMIDMTRDLPLPKKHKLQKADTTIAAPSTSKSRKRKREEAARMEMQSKRHTAGAGSKKAAHEADAVIRELKSDTANNKDVVNGHQTDEKQLNSISTSEADESSEDDNDALLEQRRHAHAIKTTSSEDESDDSDDDSVHGNGLIANGMSQEGERGQRDGAEMVTRAADDTQGPPFYVTSKYRPILGVVPLSVVDEGDVGASSGVVNGVQRACRGRGVLEVALIERPEHDLTSLDGRGSRP